jgi:quinol monooxygenase YgiN
MSHLAIVATMKLAEGVRDTFVRHLSDHRRRCLAQEPDTHVFEILVPHDLPDTVMLYEVYTDQAAFDAHMNGASIAIMRRDTAGMVLSLTGIPCALANGAA